MYKLSITGNYNVPIADMHCELTPSRPETMITDEDFEQHKAYIEKLSSYLTYTKVSDDEKSEPAVADVKEEVAKVEEVINTEEPHDNAIVDATGASSENPTAVKEAQEEAGKDIIDATDASKKSATKQQEEVQDVDNSTTEETATEEKATTPKKKSNRRKKI